MKRIFAGLAVAALTVGALSGGAFAAPGSAKAYGKTKTGQAPTHAKAHAYGKTKSAMTKCPMCGMALSSKPMKGAMAMKVNGKTYYCQSCGMHKSHKASAHKMHKKTAQSGKQAVAPLCKMCNVRGVKVKADGKTKYACPHCKMTL